MYKENGSKIYYQIIQEIDKILGQDQVFGSKQVGPFGEFAFHLGRRLVIIYFSEAGGIRTVESIGIDRKPIIF
jgi:hypothetical protein